MSSSRYRNLTRVLCGLLCGLICQAQDQVEQNLPSESSVCFIVRTYWGHGDEYGDSALHDLLNSLQTQTVQRQVNNSNKKGVCV